METVWIEKLTPDEEEYLIAQFVYEVKRRGLQVPATFAIEMHRPLAGLAETFGIVTAPFTAPLVGLGNVHGYSRIFSNRQAVDRILAALEDPSEPVKPIRPVGSDIEGNTGQQRMGNDDEVGHGA
ncbi:MAG: hypothetical protein JNM28_06075 [Armatimonadetes bacterium]|nr:hypothetical protein [Armatimonadota bacterium]